MSLDLETNAGLIERLDAALRRLEHDVVDVAQDAEDTACARLADRLGQLLGMIDLARTVLEVLATRSAFLRPLPKNRKQQP